jgi:microcystin-dependent protein
MPCGIPISALPILAPIGSVTAWLKSYANTPALPAGWVECNGQALSDSESPYNGQNMPNLNGDHRFLRGNATSGGAGGAETVQLSVDQMPSHSHYISGNNSQSSETGIEGNVQGSAAYSTGATGGDQPHENLPPYYNVVWIMRVK